MLGLDDAIEDGTCSPSRSTKPQPLVHLADLGTCSRSTTKRSRLGRAPPGRRREWLGGQAGPLLPKARHNGEERLVSPCIVCVSMPKGSIRLELPKSSTMPVTVLASYDPARSGERRRGELEIRRSSRCPHRPTAFTCSYTHSCVTPQDQEQHTNDKGRKRRTSK